MSNPVYPLVYPYVYPLPPELEELWQEMQDLRRHARYHEALEQLDPRFSEGFQSLMVIPRRWLADRREVQVREAMAAIRKAISNLS